MTARLVRGGIALATMGGALALGFASPASAADTGIPVLEKIKQCESGGNYTAENPTSSASGAYQFIDSTWQSLSAAAGYSHASDAPASVQDAAAIELYNEQGTAPWAASASCWQASGASGPASETNTGGSGAQAVTGGSGSSSTGSGSSSSGSGSAGTSTSGSSSDGGSGVPTGGVKKSSGSSSGSTQAPNGGQKVGGGKAGAPKAAQGGTGGVKVC